MVDRILIGKRPSDAQVGMWISKPGLDVSSTNSDDFLFDPSKYMARAYLRLTTGVYVKGEFALTRTFSNGTKADYYVYYCRMTIGLPYVPMFVAQLNNTEAQPSPNANVLTNGEVYYKGDQIVVKTCELAFWAYNGSDPSKTPLTDVSGAPVGNNGTWSWNASQNFITYVKGNNCNFLVYRNSLF